MWQESLNSYFIVVTVVVGAFAILFNWIYMYETARGISIVDFSVFKKYVNYPFYFSLIMQVVLWITSNDMDEQILKCFKGLSIAWIVTALVLLLVSVFIKSNPNSKKNIRDAVFPCILKVIIMAVVLWLVY